MLVYVENEGCERYDKREVNVNVPQQNNYPTKTTFKIWKPDVKYTRKEAPKAPYFSSENKNSWFLVILNKLKLLKYLKN